ncbi:MAG: NIPSNAP family protein [Gaiellaceae bacterium]
MEIRSYRLKAGSGAAFHRLVVGESMPMLERWGVDVIAFGPSLDDDDLYVLIRGYASVAELRRSQDAFYGSDEWRDGPREAIVSLIESDISVVIPAASLSIEGVSTARA